MDDVLVSAEECISKEALQQLQAAPGDIFEWIVAGLFHDTIEEMQKLGIEDEVRYLVVRVSLRKEA